MKKRGWLLVIFALYEIVRVFAFELVKDKFTSMSAEYTVVKHVMSFFDLKIPIGTAIIVAIVISMGVQFYTEKSSTDKYSRVLDRRRKFFYYILQGRYTLTVLSTDQREEISETFKSLIDNNDGIAGIQIYEVEHENSSTEVMLKLNPLVSYATEGSNEISSILSININNIKEFFDALHSKEDRKNFYESTIDYLNRKAYNPKNLGLYMLLEVLIEDEYKKSYDVAPRVIQVLNDKTKENRYKQAAKLGLLKGYFSRAVSEELYTFEKMYGTNNKKNRNYVVINMKDHKHIISIILKNTVPHEQKAKLIKNATLSVKRKLRKIEKTAATS